MQNSPLVAVVDDDDGVRSSLTSLIRSLGYRVRSYGSAPDFLEDTAVGDPDCVITDVQMPRMSGDQLQAALIAEGRRVPMIFMTAFPTDAIRDRVMAAGALCFLDKPADADTIVRCLTEVLEGSASLAPPAGRG